MSKIKVLLNFNYSRIQWVRLLEPIFEQAEIHWIRFISKEEDITEHIKNHNYHYWSDYKDGQNLLEIIKPDKVLIMDNRAPLSIALLFSAKQKKIPVYYLQHGLFGSYKDYRILERVLIKDTKVSSNVQLVKSNVNFSSISFVKSSLGLSFFRPNTFLFFMFSKIWGPRKAAYIFKDSIRIPDKYLCYSRENARIHQQVDNVKSDKIEIVGNPELENIIRNYVEVAPFEKKPYWLFIDQALSVSDLGETFISKQEHFSIYNKIADKATAEGRNLLIKLHPGNYNSDELPKHSNIRWIRDVRDMTAVIKGANYCFGFFSSLLLPCIIYKPTVLIKIAPLSFYDKTDKMTNVATITPKEIKNWKPNLPTPDTVYSKATMRVLGVTPELNYSQKLRDIVFNER
jgi:hypothetical protein